MTAKKKATKKKAVKKKATKKRTTKKVVNRYVRKRGHPTKLTPEVHKGIIEAISLGVPQRIAAEAHGVSEGAIKEWIRRGLGLDRERPAIEPFVSFAADVMRAREKNTKFHVGAVLRAAKDGDWRASAWYLARMVPEFRDQSRVQHEGVSEIKMVFDQPDGDGDK